MKLDTTKPYSQIYGVTRAKFFQNGRYFAATGDEVKDTGDLTPVGNLDNLAAEQAKEEARLRGDDDRDPVIPPQATGSEAPKAPEPSKTEDANDVTQMEAYKARLSHYQGLHVATLKSEAQGVYDYAMENGIEIDEPPLKGAGLKDRLADWLARRAVHSAR